MTDQNVEDVFALYERYTDVLEKAKVAGLQDIRDKGYSLPINNYVEKTPAESISPSEVRVQFRAALEDVKTAEEKLMQLLAEEGYLS